MNETKPSNTPDTSSTETENNDVATWSGLDELLAQFQPKDIKDLTDKLLTFFQQKTIAQEKLQRHQLAQQFVKTKHRARLICQYQWIRFILILTSCSAVTYLIYVDKFNSAAALFFGGLVAYLFGKEPK